MNEREKKPSYGRLAHQVWAFVIDADALSVLVWIANHVDGGLIWFGERDKLLASVVGELHLSSFPASELKRADRILTRCLKKLEEAGALVKLSTNGQAGQYRVVLDVEVAAARLAVVLPARIDANRGRVAPARTARG